MGGKGKASDDEECTVWCTCVGYFEINFIKLIFMDSGEHIVLLEQFNGFIPSRV